MATDPDEGTIFQNWQIVGGTGAAIFAINPSTGLITIANLTHVDLTNSSYILMVTVSDGLNTSAPQTVTVSIPDKITVCHIGELISVSKMAAVAHIQHGDCIGTCSTETTTASIRPNVSQQAMENNFIQVYPNPAKGAIYINLGTNQQHIRKFEVFDITGRLVMQLNADKMQSLTIPAGSLKPGTYMLRMQGNKVVNHKIVVQ